MSEVDQEVIDTETAPAPVDSVEEVAPDPELQELEDRMQGVINSEELDELTIGEVEDLPEPEGEAEADPEEIPAVDATETPQAETEAAVEEIPDLDEGKTPTPTDWQKLRSVTQKYKDEAKTLREQMAKPESAPTPEQTPAETPAPQAQQQPAIDDTEVFNMYFKASYDGFETEAVNADVKQKAMTVIDGMNHASLLKVSAAARNGQLGEHGEEIGNLANSQLVLANARKEVEREEGDRFLRGQQQWMGKFQESVGVVQEKFPALKDKTSAFSKYVGEMESQYLGSPEKPGPLSMIRNDPAYPLELIPLLHRAFLGDQSAALTASHPDTTTKTTKSVDVTRLPDSGGHSASETSGENADLDSLTRKIQGMGKIGW